MKVTLINYTGMGNPDAYFAERQLVYIKNTRLPQGTATRDQVAKMHPLDLFKELKYISKTIRSSWEFIDYTFEILEVSRAFTHQFVRTRTGCFAQQSQRAMDEGNFQYIVPDHIIPGTGRMAEFLQVMGSIRAGYNRLKELGTSNEDARSLLPNACQTSIIAKFNLRNLADLVGKRDNIRAQGEYVSVVRAMAEAVLAVHPWTDQFLYPERTQTPALDAILRDMKGDSAAVDNPTLNDAAKELEALKGVW